MYKHYVFSVLNPNSIEFPLTSQSLQGETGQKEIFIN